MADDVNQMDDWAAAMAEQATPAETSGSAVESTNATPAVFADLPQTTSGSLSQDIALILDIPVQLTVELGRTKITIRELLKLAQGSVVELEGLAGEPMSVLANNCLIARGEVVVVNDKFGIRLTDITTQADRIKNINK